MKFKKTVINCLTKIGMRRFIRAFSEYKEKRKYYKLIKDAKKENKIYLILTPTHNNMGDAAIAESEIKLLKELEIKYCEIPGNELLYLQQNNRLSLMNGGTIVINGGGNLGTLWFNDVENLIREVIIKNKKSKIYIMPNTIYFENSPWGNMEFQKSIQIYKEHKNLKIYAREEISFNIIKKYYYNVELMPDMVLFLNKSFISNDRNGCLICLRSDREKTLSKNDYKFIVEVVEKFFNNILFGDMYSKKIFISPDERKKELEKKFNEFRRVELVITDRLHGMIFSAITGTPCIVLNSISPKITGCYRWLKNLEYIKFCDDIKELGEMIKIIPRSNFLYDNSNLLSYYEILKKEFNQNVKNQHNSTHI